MEDFIKNLRTATPAPFRSNIANAEAQNAPRREGQIVARSGGNIQFPYSTGISQNYKDALMNAINFFQKEFKATPRSNIHNDTTRLHPDSGGATNILKDETGNYNVNFRWLTRGDEAAARQSVEDTTSRGWAPKNSDIQHVPVHELGHALFLTLFPNYDTSSNADDYGHEQAGKKRFSDPIEYDMEVMIQKSQKLVNDALKDMRSRKGWQDEAKEISTYATASPQEAIAESLADYYFNRDKAAPLSRAIVKRLKSKGGMYGINQTGGVNTVRSTNFQDNLRRYSPLK